MSAVKGKGRMSESRLVGRFLEQNRRPASRQWSRRRWFAEDVALAMEMQQSGIELWAIAHHYGTTVQVLGNVLSHARLHGMEKYPSRDSVKWKRWSMKSCAP